MTGFVYPNQTDMYLAMIEYFKIPRGERICLGICDVAADAGWRGLLAPKAYHHIKITMDMILDRLNRNTAYIWPNAWDWPNPTVDPRVDLCLLLSHGGANAELHAILTDIPTRSMSLSDFHTIMESIFTQYPELRHSPDA